MHQRQTAAEEKIINANNLGAFNQSSINRRIANHSCIGTIIDDADYTVTSSLAKANVFNK